MSRTFTVAFLRSTITAARTTITIVERIGGIRKAFSNAEDTELLMTWLIPHQQISPDTANRMARRLRRTGAPGPFFC